jgi:tetratricopeptide (TPR) repeat protein
LIDDLKPFGKKSIGRAIQKKCLENIDSGIVFYKKLKTENNNLYNFSDENELNNLGYFLMAKGEIISAIKVFELLTTEFPNSGNAFDSLGESHFENKDYEKSKIYYQKSLLLNPANTNASAMLKKIEELTKK